MSSMGHSRIPAQPGRRAPVAESQALGTVGSPQQAQAPMIQVEHVTKRIGDKVLVEDLTFEVWPG